MATQIGTNGPDSLVGGADSDILYDGPAGSTGNDTLEGGANADYLFSYGGIDVIDGGADSDLLYIDRSGLGGNLVLDLNAAATSTGTVLIDGTVIRNVESAYVYSGSGNDSLTGRNGQDYFNAGAGDDVLKGWNGRDTLFGGDGHDNLAGNRGNDLLSGGLGDDSYYIQNTADHVVETWDAGGGIDHIYSSVTYSLFGRPVENITLTGEANVDATGNSFANWVTGNAGNNTLNGMNGNDTVTGGWGADTFLFLAGSGVDTVADFSAAQGDWININAYSGGVENGGGVTITQSGADAVITLGGGHSIRVLNTTATDTAFLDQIVW